MQVPDTARRFNSALQDANSAQESNVGMENADNQRTESAADLPYVSYSANFEDVILHRIFAERPSGFYVDVGAAHPTFENDTKLLYDSGWHGINIEPNSFFFNMLVAGRPRDRNLCVALGDREGPVAYYDVVGTGLSTCDRKLADRARDKGHMVTERQIELTTLARVLDEVESTAVDLLKIDVEGFEEQVLAGNDWTKCRPSVILVEATYPESPERRVTGIRADLEKRNYRWRYFDGLNDYYINEDFKIPAGVFDSPPNIFDRFTLRAVADAERTQEEIERIQIQLQNERFERVHLTKAAARMRHEMIRLSREFEKVDGELRKTLGDLEKAQGELTQAKSGLNAVLSSRSWALSAPVRVVGRAAKRATRILRA